MDFENEFLTEQIIAYIGNKRKLLDLIYRAIESTGIEIKPGLKFFDVFSGSGIVSRFAKSLNFEVFANDWEFYSKVINSAYLGTNASELDEIFGSKKELEQILEKINSLPNPPEEKQYIAKYYAPKSDDINQADYKSERLFYTRQNALAIDKIRNYIEDEYPADSTDEKIQKARNLLLAELIYEAATHTNTSGVFKACHKEFGGHGKDALFRILSPIKLHGPVLIDSDFEMHVFNEDANELAKKLRKIDIAYLDPPYNQHQYGSNYHILNTVARWDQIPVPLEKTEKGVLKEKAGIRHDWTNTRSPYCYKDEAEKAFKNLIDDLDVHFILISYSTDGIIPFEKMKEICLQKGHTSIVTNEYTTYRGGKQSNQRKNTNIEFVLVIDTTAKPDEECIKKIDVIVAQKKLQLLFRQKFSSEKLAENFTLQDELVQVNLNGKKFTIASDNFYTLDLPCNLAELSLEDTEKLTAMLENCVCETKEDEIAEILKIVQKNGRDAKRFAKMLPKTVKKLASKKNREKFVQQMASIKRLEHDSSDLYQLIKEKLEQVEQQAKTRFET